MPYVNPFVAVDGDPMVATDVNVALTSARVYVDGGIAPPDVVDESIQTSDVYKAETYGYPVDGTIGQFQQAYKDEAGNGRKMTPVFFQFPVIVPWCFSWQNVTIPQRNTILPQLLGEYEKSPVPQMTRRVYIEKDSLVQLFASWSYIVLVGMRMVEGQIRQSEPQVRYPQFDGSGGARAGSFVLAYRSASAVSWTELPVSRRTIYPQEARRTLAGAVPSVPAIPGSGDVPHRPLSDFEQYGEVVHSMVYSMPVAHFECCDAVGISDAGWYDFTLLYDKGIAPKEVLQVVVGVRNILIEAFPDAIAEVP